MIIHSSFPHNLKNNIGFFYIRDSYRDIYLYLFNTILTIVKIKYKNGKKIATENEPYVNISTRKVQTKNALFLATRYYILR